MVILLPPVIDHALDLALGARQGVGFDEADLRREADDRLDGVEDALAQILEVADVVGEVLRRDLHLHLQRVERAGGRHDDLVVREDLRHLQQARLDLRREEVHAVDDDHVVAARVDARDAAHGAAAGAGRRLDAREVARAVADHRAAGAVERREDELARLAVGKRQQRVEKAGDKIRVFAEHPLERQIRLGI